MAALTTRATVVRALARREAELLGQREGSGHLLVAIVWEGNGRGAESLEQVGLPKGAEHALREQLVRTAESERGISPSELNGSALQVARMFDHEHISTEHQLLAVAADTSLSDEILTHEARLRLVADLEAQLKNPPSANWDRPQPGT